ncbi:MULTISPECIES: TetR family transcriptional regulator [unclassified Pseudomonas]|jgi:hypothetical protein|uniref:TetR family transcriptional regulator n=1 Tax=unclassified Pseudomonas TaxID=196821 RepID=UPI000BA3CABB|nr:MULTISPECIES: TetR/AcrR family transcriptional regulator [unclassified Pseudomonas]
MPIAIEQDFGIVKSMTLRQFAKEAGVNSSALYLYYKGKEDGRLPPAIPLPSPRKTRLSGTRECSTWTIKMTGE